MKCARFFLLLLLVPSLVHATFYTKDLAKVMDKMGGEWKRHEDLVQEFGRLDPSQKEQGLHFLSEAIECCQRAIGHCDYILRKIASKSREERRQEYWVYIKDQRNQDKNNINNEIIALQNAINSTIQDAAMRKAVGFYHESEKKIAIANQASQEIFFSLNDPEKMASILRELAKLYGEALSLAHQSLAIISSTSDQASKDVLARVIEVCQGAAIKFEQEADGWPAAFSDYRNLLVEKLSILREERKLAMEEGQESGEIRELMAVILEQLLAAGPRGNGDDAESFKEELAQLSN